MELDLAIQTLFAEFQESVFKRVSFEKGLRDQEIFVRKRVKGRPYWYLQRDQDGKTVQKYYAPSTPAADQKIQLKREEQRSGRRLLRKMISDEGRRAAMLKRGGLPSLDAFTTSIVRELSESGLIYKGGILVGSYAFSSYAGILGTLFDRDSLRTLDIDIACDHTIEAIVPPVDILELLKKCSPEFGPVPGLSHKDPPRSFLGPKGIRIDILAPLTGKPRPDIKIKNLLHASAAPLRFLDFLIKDPVSAVLLGPKGGIPVTVPDPSRFAIHKLIVSSERSVVESAKKAKDLSQASALIEVLVYERPVELTKTYKEAVKHGKGWEKAVKKGLDQIPADVAGLLKNLL